MTFHSKSLFIILTIFVFASCDQQKNESQVWLTKDELQKRVEQFHDFTIQPDLSGLTESEQKMIPHLKNAMNAIDQIFWHQMSEDGYELKGNLEKQTDSLSQLALRLVKINYSPFDVNDDKKRIAGYGYVAHSGYNVYPAGFTMNDFRTIVELNPDIEQKMRAFNTVIVNNEEKIFPVFYETKYAFYLKNAQSELMKAAELSDNESYKKYLTTLADGLLNANYRKADSSWIAVNNSKLEFIAGPLESYLDEFLQTKAYYEGLLGVVDSDLKQTLNVIQKNLPVLNKSLPNAAQWLPAVESLSEVTPVNVIYLSGGLNFSYKTISAHLPDRGAGYGANPYAKNLILTNIMQAKFESILKPLSTELLDSSVIPFLSAKHLIIFNSLYEAAQLIEPESLIGKKSISPRIALGEYSNLTRILKNHIYGMYYLEMLTNNGVITKDDYEQMSKTHTASLLRVMRFGGEDSEVIGNLILFNMLSEAGVFTYHAEISKWNIHTEKLKLFTSSRLTEITEILTTGNLQRIQSIKEKYGVRKPELVAALQRVEHLPIDVNLIYK